MDIQLTRKPESRVTGRALGGTFVFLALAAFLFLPILNLLTILYSSDSHKPCMRKGTILCCLIQGICVKTPGQGLPEAIYTDEFYNTHNNSFMRTINYQPNSRPKLNFSAQHNAVGIPRPAHQGRQRIDHQGCASRDSFGDGLHS